MKEGIGNQTKTYNRSIIIFVRVDDATEVPIYIYIRDCIDRIG